jgi:HlyD family secretion protein
MNEISPGTVTHISDRAEFTPKNVQTADARSRLVFAVKISLDNPKKILKPGMPADVKISAAE